MMSGKLFIDGLDAYTTYGVYVADGDWASLICWPPLKDYEYNDWQEEDGIEADLSDPVLDTREVSIKFTIVGNRSRYLDMVELLADGAYHTFTCSAIGREYTLRLTSQSGRKYYNAKFGQETLVFADDFPLNGYVYSDPESSMEEDEAYSIDGLPLTTYGIRVLEGSLAEVLRTHEVKENMLRNIAVGAGAIYDPDTVTYRPKDVKLKCLMRADSLVELWNNYDALLSLLVEPDERVLTVGALEQDFPCCYKECSVSKFFPTGKIWLEFTITLTFLRDFRISDTPVLLSSEDGEIVYTEDDTYAIDLTTEE